MTASRRTTPNRRTVTPRFPEGVDGLGGVAAGLGLFAARPAAPRDDDPMTTRRTAAGTGAATSFAAGTSCRWTRRSGDFVEADVLVEGKKIVAVGPNLQRCAARA